MKYLSVLPALALAGCLGSMPKQVPDQSHRLARIVEYAPRDYVVAQDGMAEGLARVGGDIDTVGDRSIAFGHVYCCNDAYSRETGIVFFIPEGIVTDVGDVVEVRAGSEAQELFNVAIRVRDRAGGTACRWLPEDPRLWRRVLYCDGLEGEGWRQQTGMWNFWIKAPVSATSGTDR
jgi:hypothetical protein